MIDGNEIVSVCDEIIAEKRKKRDATNKYISRLFGLITYTNPEWMWMDGEINGMVLVAASVHRLEECQETDRKRGE